MYNSIIKSEDCSLKLLKEKCKNLKILYVEDQEKVRIQTSKMLHLFFNNIIEAKHGKDGLKKIQNTKFDIIFTDIKMPVMDGLHMIEHIRKKDPTTPIIVFSAYDDKEYLLKTIEYGIDGYILKPFRFNTIHNLIKKIINKIYSFEKKEHLLNFSNNFTWHIESSTLYKNDKQIELTKHETMLIQLLASSFDATFTSEEIEVELFDDEYTHNKRVRSLISRLKHKIGVALIKSVYSQGYKLNLEKSC